MVTNYKELEGTLFGRQFLNVRIGCDLQIRLIGNPVRVFRIFTTKDSKCFLFDNEETAKRLKNNYPAELDYISERYYCWCIDRDDERMKILDMPGSIAEVFGEKQSRYPYYNISGYDQGYDWRITTNGKLGTKVRYKTISIEETPLAYMKIEYVEAFASLYDDLKLNKTLRFYSYEKAEKKLFGKPPRRQR